MKRPLVVLSLLVLAHPGVARAAEKGQEVEVTAGAVTARSCALEARSSGDLTLLTSCPLQEAVGEIVVFDVAEKEIYRLSKKKVLRYQLEKAFGGGSIDFSGVVVAVDKKTGIATVDVAEFSVTPKPKPGSFKGCL
ncbi:MAG: hypothetical protein IT384_32225 [Deltaproteobacteria bacterium]|nr:hypothetical protein [Deltaproteobacteria bacterium]